MAELRDSHLAGGKEAETNFDAAVIEALRVDVEVAHDSIAGNGGPGFAADTGRSPLER